MPFKEDKVESTDMSKDDGCKKAPPEKEQESQISPDRLSYTWDFLEPKKVEKGCEIYEQRLQSIYSCTTIIISRHYS